MSEEQLTLFECQDVQNRASSDVDSDDSSSLYSASASDDDSATDGDYSKFANIVVVLLILHLKIYIVYPGSHIH